MRVSSFLRSSVLGLTAFAAIAAVSTTAQAQVDRPPQYVLLAFDGSSSIGMWKTTREVAARSKLQNYPLNFTYFISGVYYVGKANKSKYIEPSRGAGKSAIGWGEGEADLLARYDQTNLAHEEHNEIASHANAHFGGDKWSLDQWRSEFKQFHKIIFDFFNFNGVKPSPAFPKGWTFSEKSMVGFRAPLLATSPGLWDTLREFGYRYDTSKTSVSNYWPARDAKGFWNFPLASLVIAGTGKKTLSMDYNFYYADSKGLADPKNKQLYKKQMLETYLQYFDRNYNGNRGPIHIGHHFSTWNDGAYWEAMQEFAQKVCGKPEVKCVTYSELADFMDSRTPAQLKGYQAGNFPKLPSLTLAMGVPALDLDVRVATGSSGSIVVKIAGTDANTGDLDRVEVLANGHPLSAQSYGLERKIDTEMLRGRLKGETVSLTARVVRRGIEIARATHMLSNVGTENEVLTAEPEEAQALMGDMPGAHMDDGLIDGETAVEDGDEAAR